MKRPATSVVAVFVAILLVTAVVVVAVGLGTDGATAVRVGDRSVSREELNDELAQWADFEAAQVRSTNGAVNATAGTSITNQVVYQLLADEYLDRTGEEVTAEDRAEVRSQIAGEPGFRERPESFRERFLERQATFVALTRLVGEDDQGTEELRVLRREARRTDVDVDPAYGRWAPVRLRVLPFPTPFTPARG